MNNQLAALSECVAHGLEDGWRHARKLHTQPTKQEWLDALYFGVMNRLEAQLNRVPGPVVPLQDGTKP